MIRVLITGATGFIGRRCVEQLAALPGIEIIAAARSPGGKHSDKVKTMEVDLLAPGAPHYLITETRPTHLLHLAWDVTPGEYWMSPNNLSWLAASVELYKSFGAACGRRAVFAGTCAEYDWGEGGTLSEGVALIRPRTLYGASKDALRRTIHAAAPSLGVSVAWGRIFWVYGPGEPRNRLVSDVTCALLEGRTAKVGSGLQKRDFAHVDDVAGSFIAAVLGNWVGDFNIGTGEAYTVRSIVERLADTAGTREQLRFGVHISLVDEPDVIAADISVLRNDIGYTPRFSIADGILDTVAWWRERLDDSNSCS